MSIKQKIWGLVAVVLFTCSVLVAVGVVGLTRLHSGMTAVTGQALPELKLASEIRTAYLTMHAIAYERASSTDAAEGKALDTELQRYNDDIISRIQTLRKGAVVPEESALLDDATGALAAYLSEMQRVSGLANMGENKMALQVMTGKLKAAHQRASAAFEKLGVLVDAKVTRLSDDANGVFTASLSSSIVLAIGCLGIFAAVGYLLARSIVVPMASMQRAIMSTAENLDFTQPVAVTSKDEIGQTVVAYNGLIKRLRESFGQVQHAAQQLSGAVTNVDGRSREIAENSRTQSDATTSMAAAIEQLTVSISVIVERALDASKHTQSSQKSADRGTKVIMNTVDGIQGIADSVNVASERIAALRSDSESISSVANMIKEIADQTNLLALNAAIEAARAGEQGRGFAVVADEVRKLAERTTLATVDISTLILKIQDAARNAVDSMSASVGAVERGVENAREAGTAIREIQSGADVLVELVDEITDAMREQSSASTTIAQQIEQIAQMTERNSSAADGVAGAVESISGMGRGISQTLAAYRV